MDAVTQVLATRPRDADSLGQMAGVSLAAHIVFGLALMFSPIGYFGGAEKEPENVMVISLGGPVGPRTGMTTMGGRPVQSVPTETKKAIEPVRPPAARTPEMIEPTKKQPKVSPTKVENSAKTPSSRTPTKGEELRKGSSPSETGARGQGFGLSSGGGGGTEGYLDTANFCCPEYISTMLELIRRNWDSKQQSVGKAMVKYTIMPDGTITGVQVERSSGYQTLDFLASRSLQLTRKLPPLPSAFTEPSLTVHLVFEYTR
jgi:TonB family protein